MTCRSHCLSGRRWASRIGSVMFSMAVSVGTRLKAWNTKPMRSRRSVVSALSPSRVRSVSPMKTWPDVRSSRPATACSSVDLPEPEGPMMAVKPPAAKSTVTPSRARTAVSPLPYTLTASTVRAAGSCGGLATRWWSVLGSVRSSMTPRCAPVRPRSSAPGSLLRTSRDVRGRRDMRSAGRRRRRRRLRTIDP